MNIALSQLESSPVRVLFLHVFFMTDDYSYHVIDG